MQDEELTKKYNSLYLEIIMRYKDEIEKGETVYVADLPKLVTPSDEAVVAVIKNITGSFPAYNFDENFLAAAQQAREYLKDKIISVSPPIQFWLKPNQVISLQAGDAFDKVILLCSMLIALGNPSTKIVTSIKENERKHLVYFEYKGELTYIDLENGMNKVNSKEELFEKLGMKKEAEMIAYEFNDKMYSNLL
ncbi:MAG: hypothetical protein ABSD68_01515 [Candidatus Micrarchaeales archaeon]